MVIENEIVESKSHWEVRERQGSIHGSRISTLKLAIEMAGAKGFLASQAALVDLLRLAEEYMLVEKSEQAKTSLCFAAKLVDNTAYKLGQIGENAEIRRLAPMSDRLGKLAKAIENSSK